MSQEQNTSFLDRKTIMAILLVGVSWIAWQSYMKKKYPTAYEAKPKVEAPVGGALVGADSTDKPQAINSPTTSSGGSDVAAPVNLPEEVQPATLVHYEDDFWTFDFSSIGMGISNLRLKKYKDRKDNWITIGEKSFEPIFALSLMGRRTPASFVISRVSSNEFRGEAQVEGMTITKIVRVNSPQYIFETEVFVKGVNSGFLGLSTSMSDAVFKSEGGGFMLPAFDHQEIYTYSRDGKDRLTVKSSDLSAIDVSRSQVQVAAIGTQYFAQAIVDKSDVIPEYKTKGELNNEVVMGRLQYSMLSKSDSFKIRYLGFAGPKLFESLERISPELGDMINFGMFSWIAKYILRMMKWFHSVLGNWGLAIILLTIIVRTLVLPFAMMSYKSMKNMQVIQPRIKALREKYKDDQTRLNQEMMELMKTNKVNPLGGCLPMLLQFPVFIALYQVLGQAIELYQAPFAFWIVDLSLKDQFYVLPVLMGITMFLQQKITPNTMDPAQAKILMFMPVIFTFFMVSLPSGLTLYIFISSLFGILQQVYFMRDKRQLNMAEVTAK